MPIWILLAASIIGGGCAGISNVSLTLPDRHWLVREQLVIHSDFPLATQHRLLEDLTARRFDLSRALGVPVSNEPIDVYLFDNADRFRRFMLSHYPEFPRRRAFFVETDTRLVVYAHWGDRVAEDLRHELTHAYLHSMVPNLPLWLDEGLAEYFEVPRAQLGMNAAHVELLRARLEQGPWRVDLQRLEQLDTALEMTQDDYAQSWAWVHFLLHSRREHARLLQDYLAQLRRDGSAEPISLRLDHVLGQPGKLLVEHVRQMGGNARSTMARSGGGRVR